MIDPFTIKPLDSKTIIDNARATRGRIITVEDHYYEGESRNKFLSKKRISDNNMQISTLTCVLIYPASFPYRLSNRLN